jgi:hypothetical protein
VLTPVLAPNVLGFLGATGANLRQIALAGLFEIFSTLAAAAALVTFSIEIFTELPRIEGEGPLCV